MSWDWIEVESWQVFIWWATSWFYGNIISTDGVKPDPTKVDIIKMPSPKTKTELASFLGMCKYLGAYIPCLSDITMVLRQLNKKNVEFTWNSTYERAFRQAKLQVANAATLQYLDPAKPILLECDASGNGSRRFITSRWTTHCICVTSAYRCPKEILKHQRELLAVVVVIEKLHHYVFGRHFSVHTDHSPLVSLFEKCLNDTSPHLRLLLCLSQYQINIQYVIHKCVPIADCMSRLIDHKTGKEDPSLNLQITNVTRANINWNQIKVTCLDDPTMIELACTIQRGWPATGNDLSEDVKPYFPYRYTLHIVDGVIFLQDRIVNFWKTWSWEELFKSSWRNYFKEIK